MIALLASAALVLNPAVTPQTIHTTVCVKGWTSTIRPPAAYTRALKRRQLPAGARLADYEEDHVLPLSLGGHPTDPRNLRPQPWPQARIKDRDERALSRAVCAGRVGLEAAQREMAERWGK